MGDGRLKRILDAIATVAIIFTCAVAVWTMLDGHLRPSVGAQANRARPPEPPPPADPISLEGASLKGNPSAKVAMIIYSDFQCPFCGKFAREVLPSLEQRYVEPGTVLLAFRQFPLTTIHPYAEKAAEATLCAGRQGKFWQMHDLFFRDQSILREQNAFDQAGAGIGLDMARYNECLGGMAAAIVQRDTATGKDVHVAGTPTFFLGSVEADRRVKVTKRLSGAMPARRFEAILDGLIDSAKRTL